MLIKITNYHLKILCTIYFSKFEMFKFIMISKLKKTKNIAYRLLIIY